MEVQTGVTLLIQQYRALLKKNLILAFQFKLALLLQIFSSLIFLSVILGLNKVMSNTDTSVKSAHLTFPPIPPCEDKFYIKLPCYDFVWSGKSTPRITSIVKSIMDNNPGRPIPPNKVKSFQTPDDVDAWLFSNPQYCPGALHFVERNTTVISYGIQTNSTAAKKRGNYEHPTLKFQVPLQLAAERAIARSLIQVPSFSWLVELEEFPYNSEKVIFDATTGQLGVLVLLAYASFGIVSQISSVVSEKELKLRQAMSTMGLYDTAYWLSWFTWDAFIVLLSSLFLVIFGILFKLDFFLRNSSRCIFLIFFLYQISMISFAFFISTFLSKASSASTIGVLIFILGFLSYSATVVGFPYNFNTGTYKIVLWSLFPPNLFIKACDMVTQSHGIKWSQLAHCAAENIQCKITLAGIFKWFVASFFLWIILALYFDNIIPNSNGVRKSYLYFLSPGYWTGNGGDRMKEGGIFRWTRLVPPLEEVAPDDEDVREEENTVKQQMNESIDDPNIAVRIRGLAKTYPGSSGAPPFHAVKGVWMNFEKDQCFCLLGPNGAGKSTTISCLTGITPVTSGDALIFGQSIRSAAGMSNIRRLMGVCPQFDILWNVLSGVDHLHLFANIKGLPPASIKSVAMKLLKDTKLSDAAKRRAGSYSGGMKRRLSVAIALIGDPKLIILDEPTTGMDPITRRHVWDIIENAKKGRAILLTTHSMEEADVLSDRIAIMAKGRLRCIGTSIRLKSRFGTGLIVSVRFHESIVRQTASTGDDDIINEPHHVALKQFFKHQLDIVPEEETRTFLTFIIPKAKEGILTRFFGELQDRERELGISDIQLGLTTLEEVFQNIARQAELESALVEGSLVTLNLTTGTDIQIPKGARFVMIPETESKDNPSGLMVEVYWEQDENGALCISGHSPETPVPRNFEAKSTAPDGSVEGIGPVKGIVLQPVEH